MKFDLDAYDALYDREAEENERNQRPHCLGLSYDMTTSVCQACSVAKDCMPQFMANVVKPVLRHVRDHREFAKDIEVDPDHFEKMIDQARLEELPKPEKHPKLGGKTKPKRKRGRPPKGQGDTTEAVAEESGDSNAVTDAKERPEEKPSTQLDEAPKKRKRGRPKGSKNKTPNVLTRKKRKEKAPDDNRPVCELCGGEGTTGGSERCAVCFGTGKTDLQAAIDGTDPTDGSGDSPEIQGSLATRTGEKSQDRGSGDGNDVDENVQGADLPGAGAPVRVSNGRVTVPDSVQRSAGDSGIKVVSEAGQKAGIEVYGDVQREQVFQAVTDAPPVSAPTKPQYVLDLHNLVVHSVDWGNYPALIEAPTAKIMQIHFWQAKTQTWIKLAPENTQDPSAPVLALSALQALIREGVALDSAISEALGR